MATWVEMSIDAYKAASALRSTHERSAISRAYYAAYAAVTNELKKVPSLTLDYEDNNPRHSKLPKYVQHGFSELDHDPQTVQEIKRNLKDLMRDRIRADYMPGETMDPHDGMTCLRRAEHVILSLKLPL